MIAGLANAAPAWNPRDDGARCDECVLLHCGPPVRMEAYPGAKAIAVGAYPGDVEVELGAPMKGPSGNELMGWWKLNGLKRADVALTNVVSCRPPAKELKTVQRRLAIHNRARIAAGLEPQPDPVTCCRPRLMKDVAPYANRIALGTEALHALVPNETRGIMDTRGTMKAVPDLVHGVIKVLPTFNPAHVLHQKRNRHFAVRDIARALRWFEDRLLWQPPRVVVKPTLEYARDFLWRFPWYAWDTETDGLEALTAKMRCISIGTTTDVIVIPWLSGDGYTRFYTQDDMGRFRALLRAWLTDPNIHKVSWNGPYYDQMIVEQEQNLGVVPTPVTDGMLLHLACFPEFRHGLGVAGSDLTDVHAWKLDKAWKDDTPGLSHEVKDENRHQYAALDACVTAQCVVQLLPLVHERQQAHIVTFDHARQQVAVGLHKVGMWVDQAVRSKFCVRVAERRLHWERAGRERPTERYPDGRPQGLRVLLAGHPNERIRALAGSHRKYKAKNILNNPDDARRLAEEDDFNVHSPDQVRHLLFDLLEFPLAKHVQAKVLFNEGGDRSTGDPVLCSYSVDQELSSYDRDIVHAIRMCRKFAKVEGSFLWPVRYAPGEEDCGVWPDGRVRASWSAHVTPVSRFSSSDPLNLQNWQKEYRDMIRAQSTPSQPRCLVGADQDALHLKIIASKWGIPSLVEAFERNGDPHALLARAIFKEQFDNAWGHPHQTKDGEWDGDAKLLRDVAKRLRYAGAYGATFETIFRVLAGSEDRDGNLVYRDLTPEKVEKMHTDWMEAEPQWEAAWNRIKREWKQNGYLLGGFAGRRRDFLDQNENDVVNFEILGFEGELMSQITIELVNLIPWSKWGSGTGLINQCHDSVTLECPGEVQFDAKGKLVEEEIVSRRTGLRVKRPIMRGPVADVYDTVESVMNRSVIGMPIPFTSKSKVGLSWAKV